MSDATRSPANAVRPLRTRILRPEWPAERLLEFEQDDAALHLAARLDGAVVAVATVYPEPPPEALGIPVEAAWQLRGMASEARVRGLGFGAAVLEGCVRAAREAGAGALWCNARRGAVGFYAAHGWAVVGPEFEVPNVGPHVVMWRAL